MHLSVILKISNLRNFQSKGTLFCLMLALSGCKSAYFSFYLLLFITQEMFTKQQNSHPSTLIYQICGYIKVVTLFYSSVYFLLLLHVCKVLKQEMKNTLQ